MYGDILDLGTFWAWGHFGSGDISAGDISAGDILSWGYYGGDILGGDISVGTLWRGHYVREPPTYHYIGILALVAISPYFQF